MNLLEELKSMLTPQPMPEGAVTVQSLSESSGLGRQATKAHLERMVKEGSLSSRVIRTTNSGGRVCEVTIYEKPTPTPPKSTTSQAPSGS